MGPGEIHGRESATTDVRKPILKKGGAQGRRESGLRRGLGHIQLQRSCIGRPRSGVAVGGAARPGAVITAPATCGSTTQPIF